MAGVALRRRQLPAENAQREGVATDNGAGGKNLRMITSPGPVVGLRRLRRKRQAPEIRTDRPRTGLVGRHFTRTSRDCHRMIVLTASVFVRTARSDQAIARRGIQERQHGGPDFRLLSSSSDALPIPKFARMTSICRMPVSERKYKVAASISAGRQFALG